MKKVLGVTADQKKVFLRIDMPKEVAESHIHCDKALLKEALAKTTIGEEKFIRQQLVFDQTIATDRCVQVTDADEVVIWQRPGRAGETPMVLGREPEPTSEMMLVLCFDDEDLNEYVLITAFTGTDAPQEPWDEHCRNREFSEKFWAAHALVPTSEELTLMQQ